MKIIWNKNLCREIGTGLPWWPSGWESTSQGRWGGFDPWCWEDSTCRGARKPTCVHYWAPSRARKSPPGEAVHSSKWPLLSATRQSSFIATKTSTDKKKITILKRNRTICYFLSLETEIILHKFVSWLHVAHSRLLLCYLSRWPIYLF